jgi:hypothetical protein
LRSKNCFVALIGWKANFLKSFKISSTKREEMQPQSLQKKSFLEKMKEMEIQIRLPIDIYR